MATLTAPPGVQQKPNYPYINPNNPDEILPQVQQQPQQQPNVAAPAQGAQPGANMPQPPQAGPVQPVPAQPGGQAQPGQDLNAQVLQAGQNKALQGFQSPVSGAVQGQTMNMLQNPLGYDPEAYKKTQKELYDKQQADTFELLRQSLGSTANTGNAEAEMRRNALEGAAGRAQFGADLDRSVAQEQRQALIDSLTQGRSTERQQADIYNEGINNLVNARMAAEGEANRNFQGSENAADRGLKVTLANLDSSLQTTLKGMDIEGQTALTQLKGMIDKDMLMTTQDFTASENALNRSLDKALAEGNWANAREIQNMIGELDLMKQEKSQQWQTAERVATQSWSTTERISTQDYQTGVIYLTQEHEKAMQENDIASAERIASERNLLDLKMQTQGFQQQEKMAYLTSQLDEARANNDVTRQKDILTFQHGQEMERIGQEQGFQASQTYLQQQHELAMQSNDAVQARVLLDMQITATAQENMKDRTLEQARIDLQQYGVDLAAIQSEVEAGRLDPTAAIQMIQGSVGDSFKLAGVDSQKAAMDAIASDMQSQRYQWSLTNPGTWDSATGTLTQEGELAFNKQFNSALYGDRTQDIINGITSTAQLQGKEGTPEYQSVVDQSAVWSVASYEDKKGAYTWRFKNTPDVGSTFQYNGGLFVSMSGASTRVRTGWGNRDVEYFTAKNVNTGEIVTIQAHV